MKKGWTNEVRKTWVQILPGTNSDWVTMGKSLNCSQLSATFWDPEADFPLKRQSPHKRIPTQMKSQTNLASFPKKWIHNLGPNQTFCLQDVLNNYLGTKTYERLLYWSSKIFLFPSLPLSTKRTLPNITKSGSKMFQFKNPVWRVSLPNK